VSAGEKEVEEAVETELAESRSVAAAVQ